MLLNLFSERAKVHVKKDSTSQQREGRQYGTRKKTHSETGHSQESGIGRRA